MGQATPSSACELRSSRMFATACSASPTHGYPQNCDLVSHPRASPPSCWAVACRVGRRRARWCCCETHARSVPPPCASLSAAAAAEPPPAGAKRRWRRHGRRTCLRSGASTSRYSQLVEQRHVHTNVAAYGKVVSAGGVAACRQANMGPGPTPICPNFAVVHFLLIVHSLHLLSTRLLPNRGPQARRQFQAFASLLRCVHCLADGYSGRRTDDLGSATDQPTVSAATAAAAAPPPPPPVDGNVPCACRPSLARRHVSSSIIISSSGWKCSSRG